MKPKTCRECAATFEPFSGGRARPRQEFCSPACAKAFNNRRALRGAELYDLFRAMRRERDTAKSIGLWKDICRLETQWQYEDDHDRPGRRSYVPPVEAVTRLRDQGRISRQMTAAEIDADTDARRQRRPSNTKISTTRTMIPSSPSPPPPMP